MADQRTITLRAGHATPTTIVMRAGIAAAVVVTTIILRAGHATPSTVILRDSTVPSGGGGATNYVVDLSPLAFTYTVETKGFRVTRVVALDPLAFNYNVEGRTFRVTRSLLLNPLSFTYTVRSRDFAVNNPAGPGYWSGILDSTSICNMALSAIGARSRIADIEEQSAEAAECNLHYAQTLNELLRLFPWNWARREEALAVLKARRGTPENSDGTLPEPPRPWAYSYARPTDCVRARFIVPLDQDGDVSVGGVPLTTGGETISADGRTPPIKFVESGDKDATMGNPIKVILTNKPQARLVYTALINDPTVWDSLFVTAFIGRLAGKICIQLSGDKALMQAAMQAGMIAESEAKATMAGEGVQVIDWTPESVAVHGYADGDDNDDYVGVAPQRDF